MSSRRSIVATAVVLLLSGIGAGVGAALVFGPNTTPADGLRSVTLPRDATLTTAIDSLQEKNILASPTTFRLLAVATGWGEQIKAGHYRVGSGVSSYHLLDRLRRGLQDPVRVTIPPGSRPDVVARAVARRLELRDSTVLAAFRDTSLARELGTTPPHLFGYLLPETYEFYWQASAERVVRRIVREFDRFYERKLAAGADSIGLTKRGVVTLASIVEWEALLDKEKPIIAGVYLNRLQDGWRLQADPTVQYVLLRTRNERTQRVLYKHLEIDHPYNTYQVHGLPPGPITNPSPSSLQAVVHPAQHDYYYFAATGDGGHTFSRTLREHSRAADQYHKQLDERRQQREQIEEDR